MCRGQHTQWFKLPDPISPPGKSPVRSGDVEGRCSGDWTGGTKEMTQHCLHHLTCHLFGRDAGDWTGGTIVDRVGIPANLPAGDYVLGFVSRPAMLLSPGSITDPKILGDI